MTVESPPEVGAQQPCFCSLALRGFSTRDKKVVNVKLPLPAAIDWEINPPRGAAPPVQRGECWHAGTAAPSTLSSLELTSRARMDVSCSAACSTSHERLSSEQELLCLRKGSHLSPCPGGCWAQCFNNSSCSCCCDIGQIWGTAWRSPSSQEDNAQHELLLRKEPPALQY